MFAASFRPSSRLQKSPNSKDDEDELEQTTARIVSVRRLDIARDDMRARQLVEIGLQARQCECEVVKQRL